MSENHHAFDELSTREGFNRSLGHFKFIMGVIAEFEARRNLADILGDRLAVKAIEPDQVLPTVNAILVDKYRYACRSRNMAENFEAFDALTAEVARWRGLDLVVVYFHPELGVVAINPKNRAHWDVVQGLKRNEMVTVFAGAFRDTGSDRKYEEGISLLFSLMEGGKGKAPAAFLKGSFIQRKSPAVSEAPAAAPARQRKARGRPPKPSAAHAAAPAAPVAPPPQAAPAPAAPAGGTTTKKMTPMYSIPVTNELFHNGNVEAWKKIIQSYTTKYPGLEVFVFYEGERIHDINTLFKWGKVKHGSAILIAVAGADIKDVAKLQRYLRQGASQMFEAFLKAPVNTVLNLF
ncbi:MAG: hypothetical protein NT005_08320 [Spirochaetes bacterium]|nr:hypothetical protein [Spirochaetota bacterium]